MIDATYANTNEKNGDNDTKVFFEANVFANMIQQRNNLDEVSKPYFNYNMKLEGGKEMDNDKILEKYLDKVDKDTYALKDDMRDSEKRTTERIAESEARNEKRMEILLDAINKQGTQFKTLENIVNDKTEKMESKIDENKKFLITIMISIVGIVAATIIGIAALVGSINSNQSAPNYSLPQTTSQMP